MQNIEDKELFEVENMSQAELEKKIHKALAAGVRVKQLSQLEDFIKDKIKELEDCD